MRFLILLLVLACSEREAPRRGRTGPPVVAVVNYPLAYFAQRLGGDAIRVHFPDIAGDPAFWKPVPQQVARFQKADLILLNGADYAKWVAKVSLPLHRIVVTSTGPHLKSKATPTHTHGPAGEHSHGGTAFTTWLDPTIAARQAAAVADALRRLVPAHDVDTPLKELQAELEALDQELEAAVSAHRDRAVIASHPVYQYWIARYRLRVTSLHWEPDARVDWRDLAGIEGKWMIWESVPRGESITGLKERGIESVVFDPCANRPASGDFMTVMRENVRNLERVYGP